MPLILVIVADPHEAAQLATLIQGRLSVDLVQAAEVGEGLLALEDRIPDLILTSPLMSPFDDGVLDEYLRDLGPTGAHVQTLRIPVLSQAPKKTKRLGFSLRRSKPEAPALDGCDPKVFADEIEQYLTRAAEEKRRVESNDQPVVIERQAVAEPETTEQEWTAAYSEDEPAPNASWSAPEAEAETEPEAEAVGWRADLLDTPPVEEETPIYQPAAYEETSVEYESPILEEEVTPQYEPIATVYEAVATEHEQDSVDAVTTWQEEVVSEPAPVETLAAEPFTAPAVAELIAEPTIEPEPRVEEAIESDSSVETHAIVASTTPAAPAMDENMASPSFKAALAAIRAAWGKAPRKTESQSTEPETLVPAQPELVAAATEAPAPFEVDLTGEVEGPVDPVAEAVDVYELSVEPDPSELESQPVTPAAQPQEPPAAKSGPAARTVEERKAVESAQAPTADGNGDGKKKGKRGAKGAKAAKPARQAQVQPQAAQNEWGIFDPNQCGFAALVDKLDEVADKKPERPQNPAKARVISLS